SARLIETNLLSEGSAFQAQSQASKAQSQASKTQPISVELENRLLPKSGSSSRSSSRSEIKSKSNQNLKCSLCEIVLKEGRNRQIRRMCARLGYPVTRLVRVAIGALQLRQMQAGEWRRLTTQEVDELRSQFR